MGNNKKEKTLTNVLRIYLNDKQKERLKVIKEKSGMGIGQLFRKYIDATFEWYN